MEITDHRQIWHVFQETFHSFFGAGVFLHTQMGATGRLMGDGMLDDKDIVLVPVPDEQSVGFLLVNFNGGDK